MDLSKLVANDLGVELEIPSIGGIGFFVILRHKSAPEVQKVSKRFRDQLADDARRGGKREKALRDEFNINYPAAFISGWRWENQKYNYKGEQPPYSPEKAVEMLKGSDVFSYYLKELIDANVGDDESFLVGFASN